MAICACLIHRYQPSQADVCVFEALGKPPGAVTPNVLRWYNHIKSFGADSKKFPGQKKVPSAFTSSVQNGSAPPAKDDDDDDVDLFGSDDVSMHDSLFDI